MLDDFIRLNDFFGLNFELTAAIAVLEIILIIFGLAFIAHFVTKNIIIKHLRNTILFKKNQFTETVLE